MSDHTEGAGDDNRLVLCTCADEDTAMRLASAAVEEGLAACVNVLPGITSIYRWQGQLETGRECLLLIKTRAARYAALEQRLVDLHPDELPELISVPITGGYPPYLAWIQNMTGKAI